MSNDLYGPLGFLIGEWQSDGFTGANRAPDPDRNTEDTNFRQYMRFTPVGLVENHEQKLYGLRYFTEAWEQGDDDEAFHEEVGYWLWDANHEQVSKTFAIPRGIVTNAGGHAKSNAKIFSMSAECAAPVYGIASNPWLDTEFKSVRYDIRIERLGDDAFRYDEDTQIKMKGREDIFHHTESNIMQRIIK